MIKIEKTYVYGWESAIRGMRNPMNSWDKSDSFCALQGMLLLGDNDLSLMKKLVKAGSDHAKFMRMINVTCDITAPLYWWKEYDTYKVGTVANSCSTMHKIHAKEFTLDDFSCEKLIGCNTTSLIKVPMIESHYDNYAPLTIFKLTIKMLNKCRDMYLETKDKRYWEQMIQLLPTSYNQKRTVQLNYAVLRNMYHARKNHKLDEWHTFCNWVEKLPYSEVLICDEKKEGANNE